MHHITTGFGNRCTAVFFQTPFPVPPPYSVVAVLVIPPNPTGAAGAAGVAPKRDVEAAAVDGVPNRDVVPVAANRESWNIRTENKIISLPVVKFEIYCTLVTASHQ